MTGAPPRVPGLRGLPGGVAGLNAFELHDEHTARLQAFFEANPTYSLQVHGRPPLATEAAEMLQDQPPPDWPWRCHWRFGWADAAGQLQALADVVEDLLAPGVCHIGLFIVGDAWHGRGVAQGLLDALQAWALAGGAQWLRLGVVQGHERAERFWAAQGFVQTRVREGLPMGLRIHTVRVLVKPLTGETLDDYRARVPVTGRTATDNSHPCK